MAQKDNSTLRRKTALRRQALIEMTCEPVVMETHGGYGRLWERCYADIPRGIVFEVPPEKTDVLARQRPTWAVYEGDCVPALAAGIGSHLAVTLLDVDPYGEPWPVLDAYFGSDRPFPPELHVVVNDGLRQKVQRGGSGTIASLKDVVQRRGNALYDQYLDVCRELVQEKAGQVGYTLTGWAGYYCGYIGQMTHYHATLRR